MSLCCLGNISSVFPLQAALSNHVLSGISVDDSGVELLLPYFCVGVLSGIPELEFCINAPFLDERHNYYHVITSPEKASSCCKRCGRWGLPVRTVQAQCSTAMKNKLKFFTVYVLPIVSVLLRLWGI